MLLLAIDTAGPDCAVAVARDDGGNAEIMAQASERIGRGHAERLMPMMEAALADAHVAFAELDRIAVTTGPGSFTGVRVGVAAARGLSLALDIPAVGVGSLDAIAYPVARARRDGTVVAALDAKRGEIYLRAENLASEDMILRTAVVKIDDIASSLASAPTPLVIVGGGAQIVAAALVGQATEIVGPAESPDIADVARLGFRVDDVRPPVPLYARGADAKPQAEMAIARR